MCIPFDPDPMFSLLGIYRKEIIMGICKDSFTKMFIVVLFTTEVIGERTNSQQKEISFLKNMIHPFVQCAGLKNVL